MDDKQMIIDGKECRYWFRPNPDDYRKCSLRGKNDNCDEITDCFIKELLGKLALKEQECEQLRNKLNSSIERMNSQNEKLHNENKELKSYIKEDLVPHTQIYVGLINRIKQQMRTILMVSTNGKYRPVKNSTKEQCYQVLGNIQELLKTNIISIN